MRFEAQARPDFSSLTNDAPPWVKKAAWRMENNGTVVDLETDPDAGYHDFRDGTHIVLDVLAPTADATAYRPPQDGGKAGPATKFTRACRCAIGTNGVEGTGRGNRANRGEGEPQARRRCIGGPGQGQGCRCQTSDPTKDAKPDDGPAPPPDAPQNADAQRTREGAVLSFAGAGNRAVAAFIRGRTAWVVLDGSYPIDPVHLKTALGDFPDSVDLANGSGDAVLRVRLKSDEQIAARAEGKNLKIVIAPQASAAAAAIGFARNDDDANHAALTTLVPGAGQAVTLTDPDAGDTLIVVPAFAGRASFEPRRYLEFAVLPTAAGLAFTPFTDDLNVSVADSRVTITRGAGLALTPAEPARRRYARRTGAWRRRTLLHRLRGLEQGRRMATSSRPERKLQHAGRGAQAGRRQSRPSHAGALLSGQRIRRRGARPDRSDAGGQSRAAKRRGIADHARGRRFHDGPLSRRP